ncbi:MAG TPA: shikimate dehydrogenase [Jatrophihabitans sp.]|nr:shikimate dehydrogenase [Jatrophihabitans sp.]
MRKHAGVLGRPIGYSLSPVLHRAAYAELGLDWSYDAIDCGVAELHAVLAERADWAGFSATMPLKDALLAVAAQVRQSAADVGAANTLLPGSDGWVADNTDVPGIIAALAERGVAPRAVTILGAGGTARAALAALRTLGVERCRVLVRDKSRAAALLACAARLGVEVTLGALDVRSASLDADLVVSTLPPGAADPLADRAWRAEQSVLDVVYAPWPTPLAAAAAEVGARIVSGALLLLHQAARQVELMTGCAAPVDAMRAALQRAAPGCGV